METYKRWSLVPKNLKSKTWFKENKLVRPKEPVAFVYQMMYHTYIELFDSNEAQPKKPPSEAQIGAIEKAKAKAIANKTCITCGDVVRKKSELWDGVCPWCRKLEEMKTRRELAVAERANWVANRDSYVILDTETTGLGLDDEISLGNRGYSRHKVGVFNG